MSTLSDDVAVFHYRNTVIILPESAPKAQTSISAPAIKIALLLFAGTAVLTMYSKRKGRNSYETEPINVIVNADATVAL